MIANPRPSIDSRTESEIITLFGCKYKGCTGSKYKILGIGYIGQNKNTIKNKNKLGLMRTKLSGWAWPVQRQIVIPQLFVIRSF